MKIVVCGRLPDCDVVLDHPSISRKHAQITLDAHFLKITDLGSRNGTFVNHQRINGEVMLKLGDSLKLGEVNVELAPFFAELIQAAKVAQSASDPTHAFPSLRSEPEPAMAEAGSTAPTALFPPSDRSRAGEQIIRVGRSDDNDVVLAFPIISRYHCEFRRDNHGKWFIRDAGSNSGSYVDNPDNRISSEVPVELTTSIYLATFSITLEQVQRMALEKQRSAQRQAPDSTARKITIGRTEENVYRIDNPQVSRKHAVIHRDDTGWWIRDLNTANGTFLNSERIGSTPVRLTDQAALFIGPVQVFFNQQTGAIHERRRGDIRLDVIGVTRRVKDFASPTMKTIVDNVSVSIYPGEMVGMMGPSGAGKTELMKLMSGNNIPDGGSVLINGLGLQKHFESFRQRIGYVPQDEIMHPELTVEEALTFSARLRLPSDLSISEIRREVDRVLEILGLKEHGNKIIGSPDTSKILSGGQRKRVNIGMELVANPELLFLDEPTSGLSIRDSEVVLQHLRKIADAGTTVVLVLHSPPAFLYKLMDNVVWMAPGGKLAFYGPTDPVSYDYFKVDERAPSSIENALAGKDPEQLKAAYLSSASAQKYVTDRQQEVQTPTFSASKPARPRFDVRKFRIYTERYLKTRLRDRLNTALMLGLAPIITIIIMLSFWSGIDSAQEFTAPLFYLAVASLWLGCSGAAREIVAEKTIYQRERMVNLRLLPYLASKLTVLGGFAVIQSVVLLIGPLVAGRLSPLAVPAHFGLLTVTNLVGISAGLLISSLSRTQAFAVSFVPLFLIPNVIFAGLAPSHKDLPVPAAIISEAFPSRYAFGAMLAAEKYWDKTEQAANAQLLLGKRQFYDEHNSDGEIVYELPSVLDIQRNNASSMQVRARLPELLGFSMEQKLGVAGWLVDIGVLIGFFGLFIGATSAVLKAKDQV